MAKVGKIGRNIKSTIHSIAFRRSRRKRGYRNHQLRTQEAKVNIQKIIFPENKVNSNQVFDEGSIKHSIFLFVCLFQFNFMFLSEDRGKITAKGKIKKISKKKEKSKSKEKIQKKAKSNKNGTCVLNCTGKLYFKMPLIKQFLIQI